MAQPHSEHVQPSRPDRQPASADEVVIEVTDILRNYLATDSRFTPDIAIERVRDVVNSDTGMKAFVNDALQPGEVDADAVVVKLAAALDRPAGVPEELVLELISIVESPAAMDVYNRAALGPDN